MKINLFFLTIILISFNSALGYTRTVENATPFTVQVTASYAEVGPCQTQAITIEPGMSGTLKDPYGKIEGVTYPCSLTKLEARVLKNNGAQQAQPYNGPHNSDDNFIVAGTQDGPYVVTRDVF